MIVNTNLSDCEVNDIALCVAGTCFSDNEFNDSALRCRSFMIAMMQVSAIVNAMIAPCAVDRILYSVCGLKLNMCGRMYVDVRVYPCVVSIARSSIAPHLATLRSNFGMGKRSRASVDADLAEMHQTHV